MSNLISYLAGLFDGEGTFSIQVDARFNPSTGRPSIRINPRMSMTLKHGSDVLDLYAEQFGGKVYGKDGSYRDGCRRWSLQTKEGCWFAADSLLPHLRVKREIGKRFRDVLEIMPASRKGTNQSNGERVWTPDLVMEVARVAFTLNPPSARHPQWGEDKIQELARLIGTET